MASAPTDAGAAEAAAPPCGDDDGDDGDEVFELPVAPVGSRVTVEDEGGRQSGDVRSHSPSGSRMWVDFDRSEGRWIGSDDEWTLEALIPEAAPAEDRRDSEEEEEEEFVPDDEHAPHAGDTVLEQWSWNADGTLSGYVFGKPGFRAGEQMTTSYVPHEGRFGSHVVTQSGSTYRLGTESSGRGEGVRRSGRASGKDSPLDAFAGPAKPLDGSSSYTFAVGGAEVGGVAADKVMRGAFSCLDDNVITLRAQYSDCRRAVLYCDGEPVAAAVAEMHVAHSVIEIPILAAAKAQRRKVPAHTGPRAVARALVRAPLPTPHPRAPRVCPRARVSARRSSPRGRRATAPCLWRGSRRSPASCARGSSKSRRPRSRSGSG